MRQSVPRKQPKRKKKANTCPKKEKKKKKSQCCPCPQEIKTKKRTSVCQKKKKRKANFAEENNWVHFCLSNKSHSLFKFSPHFDRPKEKTPESYHLFSFLST